MTPVVVVRVPPAEFDRLRWMNNDALAEEMKRRVSHPLPVRVVIEEMLVGGDQWRASATS